MLDLFRRVTWSNEEHSALVCERSDETIVVVEPHDRELWTLAIGGHFGEIREYEPPPAPPLGLLIETAEGILAKEVLRKMDESGDISLRSVHEEKLREAIRYSEQREEVETPLLKLEAKELNTDIASVVDEVLRRAVQERETLHRLELVRVRAKRVLRSADSVEEVEKITKKFIKEIRSV